MFDNIKWFNDPIGLFSGHTLGGPFGIIMIAFFAQHQFAVGSGNPNLPDGLLFGGGYQALRQLGLQAMAIVVIMVTVFILSYITLWIIGLALKGITTDYRKEELIS